MFKIMFKICILVFLFEIVNLEFHNIIIHVDTKYLEYQHLIQSKISKQDFELYTYCLNKSANTLNKLIQINEETSQISISQNDITEEFFNTIDENLITGIRADLVILVRMKDIEETFPENCHEKQKILKTNNNGRPILGYIAIEEKKNLNRQIDSDIEYQKEFYSVFFLHQFTHILGFNRTFINNLSSHSIIIKDNQSFYRTSQEIKRSVIQSSKLTPKIKSYFKCENCNGNVLELEEINYCGDEYIHWDARILSGEYMIADIYVQEQVISEFTLAILDDLGFYKVNYFTGGLMRFGRNQGDDFFTKDCNDPLALYEQTDNTKRKSTFPNEFCASNSKTTCTPGRLSRGVCDNYSKNEYFITYPSYKRNDWSNSDNIGNIFAEFCPISLNEKEVDIGGNTLKYSYIGNCKLGKRKDYGSLAFYYWKNDSKLYDYSIFSSNYGESFSSNSFCAFSSVIHTSENNEKRAIYQGFIRPTCYQMFCSERSLTIKIGNGTDNQYIVCPRGGGYIKVNGKYEGHLLCPDFNLICCQTFQCNNLFDCVEKKSEFKELAYDYNLTNVSMQILLPNETKNYEEAYEESENGKCPKNCSECYENAKCFKCNISAPFYIGEAEGDNKPINCSSTKPSTGYYNRTDNDKIYYFKCIDNCDYCTFDSPETCKGCSPEYKLTNSGKNCEPRIPNCLKYNESEGSKFNPLDNNGYLGYKYCEECKDKYFCFNQNKSICDEFDNTHFINDFGCKQKCNTKFNFCRTCDNNNCIECEDGYRFNSGKTKCIPGVPNCKEHNDKENPPECEKCDFENKFYCINNNKEKCVKIDDISLYYETNVENCFKLCSELFNKCINCNKTKCNQCEEHYFVYNDVECLEGIPNCKINEFDGINKFCKLCDNEYYCVDDKKRNL